MTNDQGALRSGALGLAAAMVFVVVNWDALTGASTGLAGSLWAAVPIFFVCGVVWAAAIRRRDAEVYERLGHFIDESPDAA
ncbi:MAG: hypothetical protein F4Y16_07620 [Holophagales bacterium]|nr:hypothetical protein [Holophagales bacterium]MYH26939.1 hypothetical protein [Holophagales bacterium]